MKKIAYLLIAALLLGLLAGCARKPIVNRYENDPLPQPKPEYGQGPVKLGLAVVTSVADSKNAKAAVYDLTAVAVLVDEQGVICDCIIDGVDTRVEFDATGTITSNLNAEIKTKNELGDQYGMVAQGGAKAEWDKQARALAWFAIGKTVEQLKNGAIDSSGKAPAGSDLASSATIYLADYVSAIEEAVNNAREFGAYTGDKLCLAVNSSLKASKSATKDTEGVACLDSDVVALAVNNGRITGCCIDSVQAKVRFGSDGGITTDIQAPVKTKNQLGYDYGMLQYGGAIEEWNAQAAAFAAYVFGMTAEQVAGIAVNEDTRPTGPDLSTCVTIAIGSFQDLILKAMKS